MDVEKKIVIFFNKHESKSFDTLSYLVSNVFFLIFFWFFVAAVVVYYDLLVGALFCLALVMVFSLHFLISEGILKWGSKKLGLGRVRPYKAYPEEIKPIGRKFADSSFPSSHLASMVGGLVVLDYFYSSIFFYAIFAVIILGWSRLRNGMHYPTDILAGILLGLVYGYVALYMLSILF
ncbi:MAG: Undecaprenyl-diphosphatase [Candidatus Moranbacteria bacterium GW2011_GWE1_36_7]|nr:MAG: Undecaprenyl-diphosphatase [Candidatus Moranbacteria bacterium GW2011_GWD2_36_12]KKQ06142.1 MAG: Undecaprenyl-diphosphatase [Candidatus Moranbacteria bacterium GW2011_GWE2_36_40]KKQ15148.1 MAG: Undecaprenyl-diphosphatase [Candidatus Moranbacteria bacterium GW2011_GWE1_36_7]